MGRVHGPELVDEEVEEGQDEDEEDSGPFRLEANGNHHAGSEAKDGDDNAREAPLALKDEAQEEEDQENAASEKEVLLAIGIADLRQTGESRASVYHRVGEDHEEAADDGEVAEEEVKIEDEAIADALDDDDAEETADGVFGVLLADDGTGGDEHGENVGDEEEVGDAPRHVPVFAQVPHLVTPLRDNAKTVLQESHYNQETANSGEMGLERLAPDLNLVLHLMAECTDFLNGVVWVGSPVARGRP